MFYTSSLASNTWVRVLPFLFLIMTIHKTSEPHPEDDINSRVRSTPRRLGKHNRWITDLESEIDGLYIFCASA